MTDEQFARLPQIARWEIERLRNDLASAKEQVRKVFGETEPDAHTPISYSYVGPGIALPEREVRWPHYGVRVRSTEDGLTISVGANCVLAFQPAASNTGYVFGLPAHGAHKFADYRLAADFPVD